MDCHALLITSGTVTGLSTVTNLGLSLSWGEWTVTLGHTQLVAESCDGQDLIELVTFMRHKWPPNIHFCPILKRK